jgi:hypothetical protein
MRAGFAAAFAALAPLLIAGAALRADTTPVGSPVGLWQGVDDATKAPTGWFLISERDGIYAGIIAKMFLKPGESPDTVCDRCTDDRHNHPWLGLEIIRGMRQDGDKYVDGTILDPRDGKVYKAIMKLSPDGQTLIVRGYLGISLLGRNQYWTRLPDSDYDVLDPSVNPKSTAPPLPLPPPLPKSGAAAPPAPQDSAQR